MLHKLFGLIFIFSLALFIHVSAARATTTVGASSFVIDNAGSATGVAIDLQPAVNASGGNAYGVRFQQTLTAAANNDALTALYINPTFNDNTKTGVTHNGLIVASGNVGIGTTNPQSSLDIQSSSASLSLTSSSSAAPIDLISYRNSAITHGLLYGIAARGTSASPLTIQAGDSLLSIRATGYGNTQFSNPNDDAAAIDLSADGVFTDTNNPGKIVFSTMAPGS